MGTSNIMWDHLVFRGADTDKMGQGNVSNEGDLRKKYVMEWVASSGMKQSKKVK